VETAPWKEQQLWRDRYRFFKKWYGWRGTLGVRVACMDRLVWRVLAQIAKLRPGHIPVLMAQGLALYRTLDRNRDGA
jgi:hypothetical protein